jgi:hypothetical protein
MLYEARELDEVEATSTLETIGDTPVWGVFRRHEDGEDSNVPFVAVLVYEPGGETAQKLAELLREASL